MMSIRKYKNISPTLAAGVYVDEQAVLIGDVEIGEDSSIWPCAVLRGDVQGIRIGARSNIQDGCVIHVTHDGAYSPGGTPAIIGSDVTVGHNATLHACTIHDTTLIGMNAVVLDRAVVESHVMVAAGAVVGPGKVLESGFLWGGSPIRKMRELKPREIEFLSYSAQHYVRLKNDYMPR